MKRQPQPVPVPVSPHIRFCASCGSTYPADGPLPYECDHHWHDGLMIMTCSGGCRELLGLPNRKPET